MKISVIMPVFNRAHIIGESIASVLAQTVKPSELIVVDDGSTDNTRAVIRGIIENLSPDAPAIHYIYQPNAGPAVARNTGFKAASGDAIALWDSDDLCPPNRFELQLALFAKFPALDFVFGNEATFTAGSAPVPSYLNHNFSTGPISDIRAAMLGQINIPTSTVMIRRDVLDQVGYMDPTVVPCEDMDLFIRVQRSGALFGIVNEFLVFRRMHDGNLINQRVRLKEAEASVLARYDCLGGDVLRWKLNSHRYDLGSYYLKRMEWDKAAKHLSQVHGARGKRRLILAIKRAVVRLAA